MLKVTHDAATLLASARGSAGAPDDFGVRFFVAETTQEGKARIGFEFVPAPQPEDDFIDQEEIPVYVAPELSESLGDATVDARSADGRSELVLKR